MFLDYSRVSADVTKQQEKERRQVVNSPCITHDHLIPGPINGGWGVVSVAQTFKMIKIHSQRMEALTFCLSAGGRQEDSGLTGRHELRSQQQLDSLCFHWG